MRAPRAKPAAASFAVKAVLCRSTEMSDGWFTCAGWPNALKIVQTCGIDVSLTTNGHVQPVVVQTQWYSSHSPTIATSDRSDTARPACRVP